MYLIAFVLRLIAFVILMHFRNMADKKKDEPEGEEEFSVEKVLDRRVRNNKVR